MKRTGFRVTTIVLSDVEHFPLRSEAERVVMDTQMRTADIVGLTWTEGNSDNVLQWIGRLAPSAPIVQLRKID